MRLQRTIKNSVTLEGRGIHTGGKVRVTIKNAPPDAGINFIRKDLKGSPRVLADVSNLRDYSTKLRCTALGKDGALIHTVEHLMAALHCLNIDNADIEIDSAEPPALDGSALGYAEAIQKAGSAEQDKQKKEFLLKSAVWGEASGAFLIALPHNILKVSYLLHYRGGDISSEYAEFSLDSGKENIFINEIAPARTFCLYKEAFLIKALGLGKGSGLGNALVIKGGRPIKNEFRLKDEPARHKILDLLGDLALLNRDIKAHIIGVKSGHSLNAQLIKRLAGMK